MLEFSTSHQKRRKNTRMNAFEKVKKKGEFPNSFM